MKKVFDIFRIKGEEKWSAIIALFVSIVLNALTIIKYNNQFSQLSENYHKLFVKAFHVAGFDPLTYAAVSQWNTEYNVYRHPLLAFFMYIPNQINQGLMMLTGYNCVQYIVGAILVFCAFYSFIFLYRIFREVIGTERWDANLLSAFYFSFAYVMVSAMVPDHFIMSMMILLTTLYITGVCIKKGRKLTIWQTVLLFLFTAGVSLNNGLKIYLSMLFVNGKRIFRPKYLFFAILLPAALTWGAARMSYDHIVWPRDVAAKAARAKAKAAKQKKQEEEKLRKQHDDSVRIASFTAYQLDSLSADSARRDSIAKAKPKPVRRRKNGKPIANGEFIGWTDITTSRSESIVENLLGESIQLHQDNVLGDVLKSRPMIVHYSHWYNYAVEGLIALLFVLGVWAGRRSRFMWLVMSYFALDMVLHIGLGFGINEVYIMSAHWIYAIPIAVAFLLKNVGRRRYQLALKGVLALLAVWLWAWNVTLIVGYLY